MSVNTREIFRHGREEHCEVVRWEYPSEKHIVCKDSIGKLLLARQGMGTWCEIDNQLNVQLLNGGKTHGIIYRTLASGRLIVCPWLPNSETHCNQVTHGVLVEYDNASRYGDWHQIEVPGGNMRVYEVVDCNGCEVRVPTDWLFDANDQTLVPDPL